MKTSDFYYDLPNELIAQHPLEKRDASRLMELFSDEQVLKHKHFLDIIDILHPGDCLVLNNSRVIPARLIGSKEGLSNPVEFLLLKRLSLTDWEVILRPGRRLRPGAHVIFIPNVLEADVIENLEGGNRIVRFQFEGVWEELLDKAGQIPLPPYIHEKLEDRERYQTVYSKFDGSAAAPTAGLHFTKDLLEEIERKGVKIAYVTLHVGLGTFRPVKVDDVLEHKMHSEWYEINEDACDKINEARSKSKRIISVGTTSCRVLESARIIEGEIVPSFGETEIFIYPGYKFHMVNDLITNFHLPESTLMMLVSALAGRDFILSAYQTAVDNRYRFFSFGDAMYIHGLKRKVSE